MGVPPQLRWLAAIGCGTVLFLYLANFNLTPRSSDHVGLVSVWFPLYPCMAAERMGVFLLSLGVGRWPKALDAHRDPSD